MVQTLALVALGGAIGSSLRHLSLQVVAAPWGTAAVNVAGSFAIGLLVVPAARWGLSPFLLTGVLGGFTTFSAFSLDALRLWSDGRIGAGAAYVAASVGLSLLAVAAGAWTFRAVSA